MTSQTDFSLVGLLRTFVYFDLLRRGFPGGSLVKNLPVNAGDARDAASIPGWRDPLEEEMATHSSILAWKVP